MHVRTLSSSIIRARLIRSLFSPASWFSFRRYDTTGAVYERAIYGVQLALKNLASNPLLLTGGDTLELPGDLIVYDQ